MCVLVCCCGYWRGYEDSLCRRGPGSTSCAALVILMSDATVWLCIFKACLASISCVVPANDTEYRMSSWSSALTAHAFRATDWASLAALSVVIFHLSPGVPCPYNLLEEERRGARRVKERYEEEERRGKGEWMKSERA